MHAAGGFELPGGLGAAEAVGVPPLPPRAARPLAGQPRPAGPALPAAVTPPAPAPAPGAHVVAPGRQLHGAAPAAPPPARPGGDPGAAGHVPGPQQPAPPAGLPAAAALLGATARQDDVRACMALLHDARFAQAVARWHVRAHPEAGPRQAWPAPDEPEEWMARVSQKAFAFQVAQAAARGLWRRADARSRTLLQAALVPGAAAWLQLPPTAAAALTNGQFATALCMRVGLDLEDGGLWPVPVLRPRQGQPRLARPVVRLRRGYRAPPQRSARPVV